MNAAANGANVSIGDDTYYFETVRITMSQRLEATPMLDGRAFRAAAGDNIMKIYLKTRIKHEDIKDYAFFLRQLLKGARHVKLYDTYYLNMALLSGAISSDEGEQYAVCELTLTEVDNR